MSILHRLHRAVMATDAVSFQFELRAARIDWNRTGPRTAKSQVRKWLKRWRARNPGVALPGRDNDNEPPRGGGKGSAGRSKRNDAQKPQTSHGSRRFGVGPQAKIVVVPVEKYHDEGSTPHLGSARALELFNGAFNAKARVDQVTQFGTLVREEMDTSKLRVSVLGHIGVLVIEGLSSADEQILRNQGFDVAANDVLATATTPPSSSAPVNTRPKPQWFRDKIREDRSTIQDNDVIIGVVDSGCDPKHTEFASNKPKILTVHNRKKSENDTDDYHGTGTVSLIIGRTLGAFPRGKVVCVPTLYWKKLKDTRWILGAFPTEILTSIDSLLELARQENKSMVLVMPLVLPNREVVSDTALTDLFDRIQDNSWISADGSKGLVVVGAIGNAEDEKSSPGADKLSLEPKTPGAWSKVIGVGALEEGPNGVRVSCITLHGRSTDGLVEKPEFVMPGVNVWAAHGEGYAKKHGTSFATALMAGHVARTIEQKPQLAVDRDGLHKELIARSTRISDVPLGMVHYPWFYVGIREHGSAD